MFNNYYEYSGVTNIRQHQKVQLYNWCIAQHHCHIWYNFFEKYRIAGKFGGGKVWQIDLFRTPGERKFGESIDQPIDY